MSDATEGAVFPGSQGGANVIEWIDRVLVDLREGRINDARALLADDGWRALDMGGIPHPILNQLSASLADAAHALGDDDGGSAGDAEAALLIARSRFLPGG
jgi:hypothetical protein